MDFNTSWRCSGATKGWRAGQPPNEFCEWATGLELNPPKYPPSEFRLGMWVSWCFSVSHSIGQSVHPVSKGKIMVWNIKSLRCSLRREELKLEFYFAESWTGHRLQRMCRTSSKLLLFCYVTHVTTSESWNKDRVVKGQHLSSQWLVDLPWLPHAWSRSASVTPSALIRGAKNFRHATERHHARLLDRVGVKGLSNIASSCKEKHWSSWYQSWNYTWGIMRGNI